MAFSSPYSWSCVALAHELAPRSSLAATDIVRSSATAAPRATKPRAPRKKRHDGPRRQSGRLQGERPIYNEDILARLVTTADRPRSHAEVAKVLRSLGRGFSEDSSPTGAAPSALVQDVYGSDDEETLQAIREKRCDNKGRGSVYDAKAGICCHFCRQKKLCAEPGCPRCPAVCLSSAHTQQHRLLVDVLLHVRPEGPQPRLLALSCAQMRPEGPQPRLHRQERVLTLPFRNGSLLSPVPADPLRVDAGRSEGADGEGRGEKTEERQRSDVLHRFSERKKERKKESHGALGAERLVSGPVKRQRQR